MPRPKRRQPNDLKNVHDRRTTDLLRNAQVSPIEVDDPLEPGGKLIVMRSTRNDPLANLHARKVIDEAQYQGGRAFQGDFETIQSRPQAVDASQPYVDRSFRHRGVSDAYSKAFDRLNAAHVALGIIGSPIAHAVLIDGLTMAKLAERRNLSGERWEKYFGMRFQECLDCLALVYGFAMKSK
jgi:hypothetical protein